MKLHPIQLRRTGESRYVVNIETSSPPGSHEFEFMVTGTDIRVVVSTPGFEAFMRNNVGPLRSLLAAILAFDDAQGVDLPDP